MRKLTNKQLKFIDEYMIDLNASAAYVRAGYSSILANTNGTKLLQNTTILVEIKKRQTEAAKKAEVTRDEIIADLKKIKDDCKAKNEYPPHALKAIEILNKMLGFNAADKQEVNVTQDQPLFLPTPKGDNIIDDNKLIE